MGKRFTFGEYIRDCAEGRLKRIEQLAMVKMNEDKKDELLINVEPGCETWIPLPTEIVDYIEYLETVPCKDHTHELVRLTLKIPEKDNAVARLFAELLLQQQKSDELPTVTSDLASIGSCRPGIIDPCTQYPDGIYREEFQRADYYIQDDLRCKPGIHLV